jgi:ssDNA-binding Zn-finger/Zn-ribbon topoisomerase 1
VFTAVRCPECGFEGRASEFARGCPSCGYMEQKKVTPAAARPPVKDRKRTFSATFYRVAGIVLLVLVVALVALLLLRP